MQDAVQAKKSAFRQVLIVLICVIPVILPLGVALFMSSPLFYAGIYEMETWIEDLTEAGSVWESVDTEHTVTLCNQENDSYYGYLELEDGTYLLLDLGTPWASFYEPVCEKEDLDVLTLSPDSAGELIVRADWEYDEKGERLCFEFYTAEEPYGYLSDSIMVFNERH